MTKRLSPQFPRTYSDRYLNLGQKRELARRAPPACAAARPWLVLAPDSFKNVRWARKCAELRGPGRERVRGSVLTGLSPWLKNGPHAVTAHQVGRQLRAVARDRTGREGAGAEGELQTGRTVGFYGGGQQGHETGDRGHPGPRHGEGHAGRSPGSEGSGGRGEKLEVPLLFSLSLFLN